MLRFFLIFICFFLSNFLVFSKDLSEEKVKDIFFNLEDIQKDLETKIVNLKNTKQSLKNQIKIFDYQKEISNNKIKIVQNLIEEKQISLGKNKELKLRSDQEKKELIKIFKRTLPSLKKEKSYFLKNLKYQIPEKKIKDNFNLVLQTEILKIYQKIDKLDRFLQSEEETNLEKFKTLSQLNKTLKEEENQLKEQIEAKNNLLSLTQGKEEIYLKLLQENKKQMIKSQEIINEIQKNRKQTEEKINNFQKTAPSKKESISNLLAENDYNLENLEEDILLNSPLLWPISPKKGLSATFLDKSYQETFNVPHYAIDIKAAQETLIRAPASAYVEKIVDNGLGYSYLVLTHKDGLSTLYGHITESLVKEGELIQLGQVIAKSGGQPGTKGAGVMTTGPHLHFEVHFNGKPKNPLDYLPSL
jgi:murein DD-endopeptidase MepM/ murein hydrolase activator NlpD